MRECHSTSSSESGYDERRYPPKESDPPSSDADVGKEEVRESAKRVVSAVPQLGPADILDVGPRLYSAGFKEYVLSSEFDTFLRSG